MKIAYFTDISSIHSYKWINYFAQTNYVIIICEKNNEGFDFFKNNSNVKIYPVLPKIYPLKKFWIKLQTIKKLKQIISENNIDIIHSMYVVPYSFWPYHLKFDNHIVTTFGSDMLIDYNYRYKNPNNLNERINNFFLKRIVVTALNKAKHVTSTSISQQRVVKTFINDTGKLHLIRTGVDVDGFISKYNQLSRQENGIVILSNRAMAPLYNIDIIVDAFNLVKQKLTDKNIKLVLLNHHTNKGYYDYIVSKITSLKLTGQVQLFNHEEMQIQMYKNCSLVVMIPGSDGTPVSASEAMLAKKPLIIGNLEYDPDLFNEETIWKINSISASSLADKIIEVLHLSEESVSKKTNAAYKTTIEATDLKREVKKIEHLYETVIEKKTITNQEKRACKKCILDTNDDPDIYFDKEGICNHCREYDTLIDEYHINNEKEQEKVFYQIIDIIKKSGKDKKYDCILGVSGGVDSIYLVYIAAKAGLRPLLVHYDNGWNSEIATKNIEKAARKYGFDLFTYVNDWEEFKDMQIAFLKASVLDIELITDQAYLATLYQQARKHRIKYIITGNNIITEGILPQNWYHWKLDVLNIRAIHKEFGKIPMKTYPQIGFWEMWYCDKILKIKNISLLNYVPYNIRKAKKIIARDLEWTDYGYKHHESTFTRFYQAYYLPVKFRIDKRKAHLSSLICSGQMTRDEALTEMDKYPYDTKLLQEDKDYVVKKLGFSDSEFEQIMKTTPRKHEAFPSYINLHYKYQQKASQLFSAFKKIFLK